MTTPTRVQIQQMQKVPWNGECYKDFKTVESLGEGSYGSVFHAIHVPTGTHAAVKTVKIDGDTTDIEKEIELMKQCNTDYIVRFFGHFFHDNSLWIVMEICGAGSVSDIMHILNATLDEREIQIILKDVLHGLSYLHQMKMIHRDIKAANILVSDDGVSKLADFGVSTKMGATNKLQKTMIGTPYWMPPEIILETGHNQLADIWSVGITAIEMFDGRPPHAELHAMRAIFMIPNAPPPKLMTPDDATPAFNQFIALCCIKDYKKRPPALEMLKCEFMKPNGNRKRITDLIEKEMEGIKEAGSRKAALEPDEEDDEEGDEEENDEEEDEEDEESGDEDGTDESDDDQTMVIKK
ncbi:serine/threonine protein kinase, putative [Entamoeba invadens IP1]|uniref:non-specific serine/threonine protein kinase n=2 Tax=Entamoeba invadens TaxID=33085 RepID=A0A0A1U167_ENTIV|nr:serine/threonine protein kinase, putative [Entamoeba invadens IP1]ELP87773.1 serine/threonine protein kinase, putative [Entamoeba invadens IP1]BAN40435.1 serine/threonine protein kinase, putative [Entamoeba invadens]|eukprot:XP_004254544.1 serine/threonine protein kinase, putative [Entamoeba invadens IP1]